ncbi:MAG: ABC transporter permease subunit, partial [Spirochaetes bacterium]|nr:ABC transporter permease subunit [Spirochaetota bacterium]
MDLVDLFNLKTFRILFFTLLQSSLSAVLCLILSIIPAYYISRKKNPLAWLIESTFFIPFFFPVIATAVAFTILYKVTGLKVMYTLTAILIAHVFYNTPIFVKYIGQGLRKIDPAIIESAVMDGAGRTRIFFDIELKNLASSVGRAFFLVFT